MHKRIKRLFSLVVAFVLLLSSLFSASALTEDSIYSLSTTYTQVYYDWGKQLHLKRYKETITQVRKITRHGLWKNAFCEHSFFLFGAWNFHNNRWKGKFLFIFAYFCPNIDDDDFFCYLRIKKSYYMWKAIFQVKIPPKWVFT